MNDLFLSLKILRIERHLSINALAQQVSINKTALHRFENGQQKLSDENIQGLYQFYGLNEFPNQEKLEAIKLDFEELYKYIFYNDASYVEKFEKIEKDIRLLQASKYYPLYYLFKYVVFIQKNATAIKWKDRKIISAINNMVKILSVIENQLSEDLLQILYDYKGCFYLYLGDFDQSAIYLQKALQTCRSSKVRGMILFHLGMCLGQNRQLHKALEALDEAKKVLDHETNYNRSLSVLFCKGNVYQRLRMNEEAVQIYKECQYVSDLYGLSINPTLVYNNLMWLYLIKQDYASIIQLEEEALQKSARHRTFYMYLAWSYYCVGDMVKSEYYVNQCQMCLEDFGLPTEDKVFALMKTIIFNKSTEKVENIFLKNEKFIRAGGDGQLQFAYQMLIRYFKEHHEENKLKEYQEKYRQLLFGDYL